MGQTAEPRRWVCPVDRLLALTLLCKKGEPDRTRVTSVPGLEAFAQTIAE